MARWIVRVLVLVVAASGPAFAAEPAVRVLARHEKSWRGTVDGLPVLVLRGTHRERGEAHGVLAGREIVRGCDHLAGLCQRRAPGGWQVAIALSRQFDVPERFEEELEGMLAGIERSTTPEERRLDATGRAVTLDELKMINTADVVELFRCSQFSAWGKSARDGRLIVGRNFDYPAILPRDTFCIVASDPAEEGLHATLEPLWFGLVGSGIATIRDDGLYIAPNSGGPSPRRLLPEQPTAGGLLIREFVESAKAERAADDLAEGIRTRLVLPMLFHLVPARGNAAAQTPVVLEFEPGANGGRSIVRRPEEPDSTGLYVANHRVRNGDDLRQGRCGILKAEVERRVARGETIGFDEARQALHAARQADTYVSVVCWPHDRELRVALAEPGKVATESRFATVRWTQVFAPR